MFEPITTKKQFVRLYEQGLLGNRSPTWNTLGEFLRDKRTSTELAHIRNRIAGARTWYNIPCNLVQANVRQILIEGIYKETDLYYSLMAPTHLTLIQGEIQQSCNHLDLFFSKVRKPMRDSLIEGGTQVSGLRALQILRFYLDAPSLEWVEWLLEVYQNHVIEFSVYERRWGTLNRNTIIWEVRGGY